MRLSTTRKLSLVALLILATGCGNPISPAQKRAILNLQERGGQINFRGSGYEVILNKTTVTDEDLENVVQLEDVSALDLSNTEITDAGLKKLEKLESLEMVTVFNTKATPEGIERLEKALPKAKVFLERAPR